MNREQIIDEYATDLSVRSMLSMWEAKEFVAKLALRLTEPQVSEVVEFVESCGTLSEYVDGDKIDHRFKDHTIPVIEFNELREAAKLWKSHHPKPISDERKECPNCKEMVKMISTGEFCPKCMY